MFQNPKGVLLVTAQDASGINYFTIASRDVSGFAKLGQLIGEGIGHSAEDLEALLGKCEMLSELFARKPYDRRFFISHFHTDRDYPRSLAADGFFDKCDLGKVEEFQNYVWHAGQYIANYILHYFASAARTN